MGGVLAGGGFLGDEDEVGGKAGRGVGDREGFRGLAAGAEVEELAAVSLEQEDGNPACDVIGGSRFLKHRLALVRPVGIIAHTVVRGSMPFVH